MFRFRKIYRPVFLIPVLLCIIMAGEGCTSFRSLEYRGLSQWEIIPLSFAESQLGVQVKVFNPNKHRIAVKRLSADIEVDGKKWSSIQLDSTFWVPAEAEYTFPLQLKVKNSYIISGVASVAGGRELPYLFKGKIRGTYRKLTAEVPFEYKGSFSDKDIRL